MTGNKTVLIVDDDPRNVFALSALLKAKGYGSITATSAAEGLQFLTTRSDIGIVLMDMMMPGMDGYEAIPVIRNNEKIKALPIVAVTAQAMAGDKEKCLQAGADHYLSKPIDVDALLNLLDHYLK